MSKKSPKKDSDSLSLYSTKELLIEVKKRLKSEYRLGRLGDDTQQSAKLRIQENNLLQSITDPNNGLLYKDENANTEALLGEKMWSWLSTNGHGGADRWAQRWIEDNPAPSVGTKNLSNREKWLEKTLKNIPKGKKILDAGAGELQYKRFCNHLEYLSQDFGQYNGEGNEAGLQMGSWDNSKLDIISDIGSIPVNDSSFDAIMCIEVFEHIPKPIDAIKEFSRIMKPGGELIITTPFCALTHFAPYFFYNGYSRYFFETILPEHGFEIEEITLNGNYFEYLAQEVRRLDEMASKYARKVRSPDKFDELIKQWLLLRLEKLSSHDTGSNELLFQGIQVRARKK